MYFQITTRCNMRCEHCCYSCTKDGDDMTLDTFRRGLELCHGFAVIGGGEPTLHEHFEIILLEAIVHPAVDEYVYIVTNGSVKKRALMIAELINRDVIGGCVSLDQFHDPIDPEVIDAFGDDYRDVTEDGKRRPTYQGRYLETHGSKGMDTSDEECICPELFVRTDGTILQCGCADAPVVGDVKNGLIEPRVDGACYRSAEYQHVRETCCFV